MAHRFLIGFAAGLGPGLSGALMAAAAPPAG